MQVLLSSANLTHRALIAVTIAPSIPRAHCRFHSIGSWRDRRPLAVKERSLLRIVALAPWSISSEMTGWFDVIS